MAHANLVSLAVGYVTRLGLAGAVLALGFGTADISWAQQKQKQQKQPAQKEQAPPTNPQSQSAWVKLCEKAPFAKRDKDGKEVREDRSICLTHHERLDGNTGMVLVSAALRQVEASDKQHLMIMVPLGMALQAGLKAAVYPAELWDKVQKNEKIDEKQLKPMDLRYTICHPAGCTAEVEATPELLDQLQKGGGLMVLAINAASQPIAFPIPLTGFSQAHAGKPVDNVAYAKARGQLMEQIRQRQAQLIEEQKKQQAQQAQPQLPPGVPPPKKQ